MRQIFLLFLLFVVGQWFVKALKRIGYRGPLCIEREVGTQAERFRDIEHGVRYLRECLAEA